MFNVFFLLPYRKWWWSPKATEKMQGDYFHEVRHRIAGDATEFGRKQKVNLWELSQRSRHSRGGEPPNISVTNYFLGKSAVSISNLSFLPRTKWAWANQPISPASQKTTGAFGFFLGKPSFWLFINYSNWLSWLMTRPGCEKQQKKWAKRSLKNRLPLHSIHLEICVSCQMFHYVIGHFWALLGLFPPS